MRINQKVRYGLVCLHELAQNYGGYMSAEQVAQRRQMPGAYTQKILQRLASEGLVESLKGAGYRLLVPLSEISAYRLVDAFSEADEMPESQAGSGINFQFERRVEKALKSFSLAELTL